MPRFRYAYKPIPIKDLAVIGEPIKHYWGLQTCTCAVAANGKKLALPVNLVPHPFPCNYPSLTPARVSGIGRPEGETEIFGTLFKEKT
jgi:hypothetical protein